MTNGSRTQKSRETSDSVDSIVAEVEVDDANLLVRLAGPNANHLDTLESEFDVKAGVRGNTIFLRGDRTAVEDAERVLMEILTLLEKDSGFSQNDVERSLRTLANNPEVKLGEMLNDVVLGTPRKTIKAKGPAQSGYVRQMRENDIVFGIGPAGTGKTYLAMAMAVRALLEKRVKRILLTRPAVEAGEKLGFLPGDLAEKVNPYLRPLYDALHDMMDIERAQLLVQRGVIEVAPLAFMRGRTLNDAFVILDEAQNSTSDQMRMFLTRLGFGSKAVVTGDATQVDLPHNARSGLADAVRLLGSIDGIGVTYFTDADVVRHPLVAKIVRAYEARDSRENPRSRPHDRFSRAEAGSAADDASDAEARESPADESDGEAGPPS